MCHTLWEVISDLRLQVHACTHAGAERLYFYIFTFYNICIYCYWWPHVCIPPVPLFRLVSLSGGGGHPRVCLLGRFKVLVQIALRLIMSYNFADLLYISGDFDPVRGLCLGLGGCYCVCSPGGPCSARPVQSAFVRWAHLCAERICARGREVASAPSGGFSLCSKMADWEDSPDCPV